MQFTDTQDDPEDPAALVAERAAAATRSTWVGVGVNLALASVQIVAGVFTRSQGLIADGVHSLSDLVADFVVLFASHHASKDADLDHPYGHQRVETAASLALGLILLVVGVGMLWAAVGKLQAPEDVQPVHLAALWVAMGALLAKELLFRYMLGVGKRVKSSLLVANAWHARSDAASSLVVGLGIAGNLAGYPILDPVAALIVGFMVARMGWSFGWDALQDLIDRAASEEEVAAIHRTLQQTPGVQGVHDVRTRKMGDMIVVDAHIEVDAALSVEAGHSIAVEARQRVMRLHRVINLMTHIDPWHRPDLDHAQTPAPQAGPLKPPMLEALFISTGVVALAEIGDKTQLLAFMLATRFKKPWPIVAGILVATLANHGLAGALGAWITAAVPPDALRWVLGLSFIGMALWTLVPDKLDAEDASTTRRQGVFGATLVTFFLAEMGDKTQVATVALAAHYAAPWTVVAGTTLGMLLADVPAVFLGDKLAGKLPLRLVHAVAAGIFALMGVLTLLRVDRVFGGG